MAQTDLIPPRLPLRFGAVIAQSLRLFSRPPGRQAQDAEEARARRAALQDLLDRNPKAFAGEHDLHQAMMACPGYV